ncbi:MAG: membrane protein insertase YidC [Bryobacteraceae bacterium]
MPNTPGGGGKKPTLEKRLPLALALMLLVLVVSQYVLKPPPKGPKPAKPANEQAAAKLVKPVSAPPPAKAPAKTKAPAAAAGAQTPKIQAASEVTTTVDTSLYHIVFSNRGAVIKSWVLKRYTNQADQPLDLANPSQSLPAPFSLQIEGPKPAFDPNTVLYRPKVSDNGLLVQYEYSDGQTTITKSFQFRKDSYLARIQSAVVENGNAVPSFLMWRGGFGDKRVHSAASKEKTVYYNEASSKLVTKDSGDAKKGPVTDTGNYAFAGLENTFFAAVALPENSSQLRIRTYSDTVKTPGESKPVEYVGSGLSSGLTNDFSLFVGPKEVSVLKKVNPKLANIIDWGFFSVLAKPIFYWLKWTEVHWTANYGWAIVILTILINLAVLPLRLTSMKSARKMQRVQPLIKAISDKYKNIGLRDPRKAEQQQETMALYKREGINPFGGCLPMLIQLPFLYAFYEVLYAAIELRHAHWLWITDLSSPETLPVHILPLILVVTQFYQQKLTPTASMDPKQQRMMMLMPVVFGFMFYYLSSGLVLYYLTSNLAGIGLQLIINKFMPLGVTPAAAASPAKAIAPIAPGPKTPAKAPVKRRAGKR